MPVIKVFKSNKSLAIIIPKEIVYDQRIYPGSYYDAVSEGHDRIILQRLQMVTPAPTGSIWTVVKA